MQLVHAALALRSVEVDVSLLAEALLAQRLAVVVLAQRVEADGVAVEREADGAVRRQQLLCGRLVWQPRGVRAREVGVPTGKVQGRYREGTGRWAYLVERSLAVISEPRRDTKSPAISRDTVEAYRSCRSSS